MKTVAAYVWSIFLPVRKNLEVGIGLLHLRIEVVELYAQFLILHVDWVLHCFRGGRRTHQVVASRCCSGNHDYSTHDCCSLHIGRMIMLFLFKLRHQTALCDEG